AAWDKEANASRERHEAKVLLRKYQTLHEHSVIVRIWNTDGQPLETYTAQGIATWPMFTLASQLDVLELLSLKNTDFLERYDLRTRFWISEKVDTVVRIHKPHAQVLYRPIGLKNCIDIDRICEEATGMRGPALTPHGIPRLPASTPSQALPPMPLHAHTYLPYSMPLMPPMSPTEPTNAGAAPTLATLNSQRTLSPMPSTPTTPALPLDSKAHESGVFPSHIARFMPTIPPTINPPVPDDLDRLWSLGIVHTPPLQHRSWPFGIFARDMGIAMLMLGDATAATDNTLPMRFSAVFQGRPFKNATYNAQRLAWLNSPEEQRQWILRQPRTKAGLWTECRRELKGWQDQPDHKRH
ncbi:hypothetical protein OH77DRAFT_1552615, partial [Trametes cingulata]